MGMWEQLFGKQVTQKRNYVKPVQQPRPMPQQRQMPRPRTIAQHYQDIKDVQSLIDKNTR